MLTSGTEGREHQPIPDTGRVGLAVLRVPLSPLGSLSMYESGRLNAAKSGRFVDAIWALGVDW